MTASGFPVGLWWAPLQHDTKLQYVYFMRILFADKMFLQTNLNYVILIEFLRQFNYCEFVLIETLLLSVNIIYVVDWFDMIFFVYLLLLGWLL